MLPLDDTIAAIATAPGAAGLAVVRLSGPAALAVADAIFEGGGPLAEAPGHTLRHGWAVARGDAAAARLDEVVAAVFRAPRSYTGEDTVEFSCHGGGVPARRVLSALLAAGARLAGPGEFTLRAYLHGRLDLAQAEAVADLVHAETESAGDLALSQLSGVLSARLAALEERISDAAAEVEARVDFAEDVGGIETPEHVRATIREVSADLANMLAGAPWARAVREGVRVPLVGLPNAGKSSLFNALLGEERAIVTDEPGTTRDRVSERVELSGVAVTLSDTAGVRVATNPVEAMGVARALAALEGAGLVLWVVDGTSGFEPPDPMLRAGLAGRRLVAVLTKADLPARASDEDLRQGLGDASLTVVSASAVTGVGLDELRRAMCLALGADQAGGLTGAVANPRHTEALTRSREALQRADAVADRGEPGEIE